MGSEGSEGQMGRTSAPVLFGEVVFLAAAAEFAFDVELF
jgi:hypothetical protein